MDNNENKTIKKTQVYNVIILDRSGSMNSIRQAAVTGFNETLAGIKKAQEKFADTQDHFITLLTFCSCENKYVYDKVPASEAQPMNMDDYQPCCCTPLYDAMGMTLTSMLNHVKDIEDVTVVATIITDGMENASKEYSGRAIKELVGDLRKKGWSFTYMGANQDAVEVASELNIRNARNFDFSMEGATLVMEKDADTRLNYYARVSELKRREMESGEIFCCVKRQELYKEMSDLAFDEEESK